MNNNKVELFTIIDWVSNRIKELTFEKKSKAELVLLSLSKSASEYLFEPNDFDNTSPPKIYISGNEKLYPNALALLILMVEPTKLSNLLEYHKNKFEQSVLIKNAPFKKLLTSYVKESLFLNGNLLGFQPKEISQKLEGIDFFINRTTVNLVATPIRFYFKPNQKEKIVKALTEYVPEDDKYLINLFLSDKLPPQKIKFNIQANVIAELFLRFYKHKIIFREETSYQNTSKWLSDRMLTKKRSLINPFISPSHQALFNVLRKKEKLPTNSNRILTDILP